jgi:hypothetical protein
VLIAGNMQLLNRLAAAKIHPQQTVTELFFQIINTIKSGKNKRTLPDRRMVPALWGVMQ